MQPGKRLGHVRFAFYIHPELAAEIVKESRQKKITIGRLIEDIFRDRLVKVTKR